MPIVLEKKVITSITQSTTIEISREGRQHMAGHRHPGMIVAPQTFADFSMKYHTMRGMFSGTGR
jgi:hypothetical protein